MVLCDCFETSYNSSHFAYRSISKGSVATDFLRLFQEYTGCGGYQRQRQMSDGHLVLHGAQFVMGCLFDFSIAQTREVLFNGLALSVDFFELIGASLHL